MTPEEHEKLVKKTWVKYRETEKELRKLHELYKKLTWESDRWCGICDKSHYACGGMG